MDCLMDWCINLWPWGDDMERSMERGSHMITYPDPVMQHVFRRRASLVNVAVVPRLWDLLPGPHSFVRCL